MEGAKGGQEATAGTNQEKQAAETRGNQYDKSAPFIVKPLYGRYRLHSARIARGRPAYLYNVERGNFQLRKVETVEKNLPRPDARTYKLRRLSRKPFLDQIRRNQFGLRRAQQVSDRSAPILLRRGEYKSRRIQRRDLLDQIKQWPSLTKLRHVQTLDKSTPRLPKVAGALKWDKRTQTRKRPYLDEISRRSFKIRHVTHVNDRSAPFIPYGEFHLKRVNTKPLLNEVVKGVPLKHAETKTPQLPKETFILKHTDRTPLLREVQQGVHLRRSESVDRSAPFFGDFSQSMRV